MLQRYERLESSMNGELAGLKALVRTIPNFPKPGVMFRDISTLFIDPWGMKHVIANLTEHYRDVGIDKVIGIESRGFIAGGALAANLGCGFVMARKRGKLPGTVERVEYELEYGKDCIEIHKDAISPGDRCLILDDLLATGGTSLATCRLAERLGAKVIGCAFVINLPDLGGAKRLHDYPTHWLMEFAGD